MNATFITINGVIVYSCGHFFVSTELNKRKYNLQVRSSEETLHQGKFKCERKFKLRIYYFFFFPSEVFDVLVIQGKHSERRPSDLNATTLHKTVRFSGNPPKSSTAQGEHLHTPGQTQSAPQPGQQHQPGAQTCTRAAEDPHKTGQGEGQSLQEENPQEGPERRSGNRLTFKT